MDEYKLSDIHNEYFDWLCDQVSEEQRYCFMGNQYRYLLDILYDFVFYVSLDRDENRLKDGQYLRYLFAVERGYIHGPKYEEFRNSFSDVSVLEVLVAFCKRIGDEILYDPNVDFDPSARLFWTMIFNADLAKIDGECFPIEYEEVCDKLVMILDRDYDASGAGGFFPLRFPKQDQRNVELWYQFMAYDQENS